MPEQAAVPDQEASPPDATEQGDVEQSTATESLVAEEPPHVHTATSEDPAITPIIAASFQPPEVASNVKGVSADVSLDRGAPLDVDVASDPDHTHASQPLSGPHRVPDVDRDPDAIPAKEDPIDVDGMEDSFDEADDDDDVADVVDEDVDEDDANSASEHEDGKRGDAIDLTESVEGTPPTKRRDMGDVEEHSEVEEEVHEEDSEHEDAEEHEDGLHTLSDGGHGEDDAASSYADAADVAEGGVDIDEHEADRASGEGEDATEANAHPGDKGPRVDSKGDVGQTAAKADEAEAEAEAEADNDTQSNLFSIQAAVQVAFDVETAVQSDSVDGLAKTAVDTDAKEKHLLRIAADDGAAKEPREDDIAERKSKAEIGAIIEAKTVPGIAMDSGVEKKAHEDGAPERELEVTGDISEDETAKQRSEGFDDSVHKDEEHEDMQESPAKPSSPAVPGPDDDAMSEEHEEGDEISEEDPDMMVDGATESDAPKSGDQTPLSIAEMEAVPSQIFPSTAALAEDNRVAEIQVHPKEASVATSVPSDAVEKESHTDMMEEDGRKRDPANADDADVQMTKESEDQPDVQLQELKTAPKAVAPIVPSQTTSGDSTASLDIPMTSNEDVRTEGDTGGAMQDVSEGPDVVEPSMDPTKGGDTSTIKKAIATEADSDLKRQPKAVFSIPESSVELSQVSKQTNQTGATAIVPVKFPGPHVPIFASPEVEADTSSKNLADLSQGTGYSAAVQEKPTVFPAPNEPEVAIAGKFLDSDQKAADTKSDEQAALSVPLVEPESKPTATVPGEATGPEINATATIPPNLKTITPTVKSMEKTSSLPQASKSLSSSSTFTTPLFGIQPPNRTGPVSFSSPPSFHQSNLSPTAAPFVPATLGANKTPPAPVGPPSIGTVKVPQKPEQSTVAQVKVPPQDVAMADVVPKPKGQAPAGKSSQDANKTLAPTQMKGVSKAKMPKPAVKPVLKRQADAQQTLRRVPIEGTSGGMSYTVDNVMIIVREGTSKPVRRFTFCTVEAKIRPDGESTLEFFEGRDGSKSSFAELSSKKNRVRIKKVVNKPFVFSVTVLGPSGQEKGSDVAKYFIHLQKHTFDVFYDACMMYILDVVKEKPRPKTVRFQEPTLQQKTATAAPKPNPTAANPNNKAGVAANPKVVPLDQRKLLLLKMEALKKKKTGRCSEGSPSRNVTSESSGKRTTSKPISTPGLMKTNLNTGIADKQASTAQKQTPHKKTAAVAEHKIGDVQASQRTVGHGMQQYNVKLQLLTPTTRPVPSSPKKRPAFRLEERGESSMKKARLAVPKKRPVAGAHAEGGVQRKQIQPQSSLKRTPQPLMNTTLGVSKMKTLQVPGASTQPAVATSKPISVVMQPAPAMTSGVNISLEEKEAFELDGKRLTDVLAAIKSAVKSAGIGEAHKPESLSRCEPKNVSDFFDRLHTFRPSTWRGFARGHALSAVECARHGWHNSDIDELTSSEGSVITAKLETCFDSASMTAEIERVRKLVVGGGHRLLSGWIGESSPLEFESLEGSKRTCNAAQLKTNAKQLESKRVVEILGNRDFDSTLSSKGLSAADKYRRLACYNWKARGSEEDLDLYCDWCGRSVLLTPEDMVRSGGKGCVEFDVATSHYVFCPFGGEEGKRNAEVMGMSLAVAVDGVKAVGDVEMSDT